LESGPYLKYLKESQALALWQGSSNIIKCFVGVSGILHLRDHNGQDMVAIRNPLLNPIKSFKYFFDNRKHDTDKFKYPLKLEHNVHPSMRYSAQHLEYCVHKLAWVTRVLVIRRGANAQLTEGYLERLSDIAMETYAMTCVLSRASRSYVVGNLHAEHDMDLATAYIFEAKMRVRDLVRASVPNSEGNRDEYLLAAANYMTRRGSYVAVSPLAKNTY